MKQIRYNVFETNSSSSHSLVIKKNNDIYTGELLKRYVNEYGELTFFGDDPFYFGRYPFEILYSQIDKTRYMIALYGLKKVSKVIKEICPDFKYFVYNKMERDDLERYGEINYRYHSTEKDDMVGEIDHQSCDVVLSYMERNNISIKDIILNDKYVIIVDGDEYDVFGTFKESNLLNIDGIEEIISIYGKE